MVLVPPWRCPLQMWSNSPTVRRGGGWPGAAAHLGPRVRSPTASGRALHQHPSSAVAASRLAEPGTRNWTIAVLNSPGRCWHTCPCSCLGEAMTLAHLSVTTEPLPCPPQGHWGIAVALGVVIGEQAGVSCPLSCSSLTFSLCLAGHQLPAAPPSGLKLASAPTLCPAPSRLS